MATKKAKTGEATPSPKTKRSKASKPEGTKKTEAEQGVKTSLKDLKPEDFPSVADAPANLDVNLGEIEFSIGNEKEIQKISQSALGIRKWVESHMVKLDELRKAPKAVRIREENKQKAKVIRDRINDFLWHKEEAYRQGAWTAFLIHRLLNSEVETYSDTMSMLDQMVRDGYLEEGNEHSPLQAWRRRFRIPEKACFTRPEFEEAKRAMASLVNRVTQSTARRRQDRIVELQEEADLKPNGIFEQNAEGKALLYVPPQISRHDNRFSIRKEGFLLVEANGGRIIPLEGVGSFEEAISDANDLNIFVRPYTLSWDWPPPKRVLIEKLVAIGDTEEKAKEKADAIHFCWYLFKRAKDALEQTNQYEKEKLEMSKEVTISEEDFLLEGRDGDTLIDFEGSWETWTQEENGRAKKTQIGPLFALVRRQNKKISMIKCPEHLTQFFAGCTDEYDEGDKFLGIPQPLQSVLQAQFGAEQTKSLLCRN